MADTKIERWTLEDGRRAERHITDSSTCDGERVVEIFAEEERPVIKQQRIIEKRKPFVYERKIETLDKDGNVVELKTESVEPKVNMQVVEHIATQSVASQSVASEDCDCHVTREELLDTVVAAIKASRADTPVVNKELNSVRSKISNISSMGIADEIAKKVNATGTDSDTILNLIIMVMVGILVYQVFF